MSLPLLGNDFLMSPTAGGVISGKTAELLASQGSQMAQQIEMRSQVSEAQMKAPQVTDMYSTAYQKIAQGDFTGFADMQKARSLAIGNPILMKTMDEADQLAGTLAGEYTRKQIAQMQTDKAMELAKFQYDKSMDIESHRDTRAAERETQRYSHDSETTARSLYISDHNAWERENLEGQKQYERELKAWEGQQNAEQVNARLQRREPNQIPKPEPFKARPEPQVQNYLSKMATPLPSRTSSDITGGAGNPLFDVNDVPSQGPIDGPVPTDSLSVPAPAAQPQFRGPQPNVLPSQDVPDTTTPPLVNQRTHQASMPLSDTPASQENPLPPIKEGAQLPLGTHVASLGSLKFVIPEQGAQLQETKVGSEGKIENTYKLTHEDDKFIQAIGALNRTYPDFARFISDANRAGEDIGLHLATDADLLAAGLHREKGTEYYTARAGGTTLAENDSDYSGRVKRDKDGKALPVKPVILEANGKTGAADLWKEGTSLMDKTGVQATTPAQFDEESKPRVRDMVLADVAAHPEKILGANNTLQSHDIDPITPEEITAFQQKSQQQVKSQAEDARAERYVKGLIGSKVEPPDKKTSEEYQQEYQEANRKMQDIHTQIQSLADPLGKDKAKAIELGKQAVMLRDKANQAFTRSRLKAEAQAGGMWPSTTF